MSANDEASGNTPTSPTKNMGNDSQLSKTINLDFRRLFETGLTVENVVVLIGVLVILIFIVVISIGVKVFCCHDKRKFRSSKDVKCVRHQESMTSPLDSPLRSVMSLTTQNGQQIDQEQDTLIRTQKESVEMQPNYATLPTPSVRGKKKNHENENGRIIGRSHESPSVYKTSSAGNVSGSSSSHSPTKPIRTRKRSESSITSQSGGRQINAKVQIHDEEKAPKGTISEVNISQPPPPSITVQLNEEMKSKLSAIKDPSQGQSVTNQRPPIKPPNHSKDNSVRPQKSYSTTSNALTSSELLSKTQNRQNQPRIQPADNLPRMWFVSLDNITPEPVYRGQV